MAKAAVLKRVVSAVAKAELSATPDRELLRRFAAEGDQAAFAALVRRHTGLVLGVCRRSLPTAADAEDACQAVFLVLAKKAASQRWQPSIANWLFTTARKVARDARLAAARRSRREGAAAVPEAVSAADQMTVRELLVTLDEELDRLSVLYREPLVLCYLEGLTRDEVALRLGVPAGTVKIRLERARKKLADALTGRGVALGIGLLTLAATSSAGASSPKLFESIVAAAGGSPSPAAAALAQGVAVNGILTHAKWTVLAVAGAAMLGFGLASHSLVAAGAGKAALDKAEAAKPLDEKGQVVAGRVVGADGKPAAAELVLLRSGGSPLPLGKSGADGRFRVVVPLGADDIHLVARIGGQGVAYTQVSPRTADVTLKLTKDNPIRGRVIDTQGKPVAGAVVFPRTLEDFGASGVNFYLDYVKTKPTNLGRLQGQYNLYLGARTEFDLPGGPVLAATTDKDGRFELAGLGAERVVGLRCRAAGLADAEVTVVNRAKFDPAALNKAAADTRERMLPKGMRHPTYEQPLHGSDGVTLVAEQEKVIRGVVKARDTGRPRPGVTVTFGRVSDFELVAVPHTAVTDKDGKFTFRGCRKYSAYVPEVAADVEAGYLPSQAEAKDTAGYEPIDIEIACVRGVVVTGKMTDKATGKPIAGNVVAVAMLDNQFLKKAPPMDRGIYGANQTVVTSGDGSFRLVTPPGPVLVMAGLRVSQYEGRYKPVQADPDYPQYFHNRPGWLAYTMPNGGYDIVRGCWCKVINLKGTENGHTLNVELEPAAKNLVRVVGPDGKPVPGCDATGTAQSDTCPVPQETDKVAVYGLGPKERRFVVLGHQTKKLVGAAVVQDGDKDPVVKLGPGGAVTGRVVGADGKPIAGLTVTARFDHPSVEGVSEHIRGWKPVVTAADGTFRIDGLFPGHGFRLRLSKGPKNYTSEPANQHVVEKHGDALKLGDVKAKPTQE